MTTPAKKADEKGGGKKVLMRNKRARHEYFIEDTMEAGMVLMGSEVKSLRAGKAEMTDAYAEIENGQATLRQMRKDRQKRDKFEVKKKEKKDRKKEKKKDRYSKRK